jgi:phenylacetate-CoA ligase
MNDERDIFSRFEPAKKKNWLEEYYHFSIEDFEHLLRSRPEAFWQRAGERRALRLFHAAAKRVPAYKEFLGRHKIKPQKIRTIKDFIQVPETDKKNYINAYGLEKRCWDGDLARLNLLAESSGTTGEPKFWPRGGYQEFEASIIHELIYRYSFDIDKYKTLLIVGFPMGVYVSGVATLFPSLLVAGKYNMSVVSPGNNKAEVLRTVEYLQKDFEQIILIGHPFFIKDVIESGRQKGIHWSRTRLRLMFCSEGFNETWRRYVVGETGRPFHYRNTVSTYGSSELLLMAHETPLSIYARNLMDKNEKFKEQIVTSRFVPNFFQYNPIMRYIETSGSDLLFTSASGLPLMRYNLHDGGSIVSFKNVLSTLDLTRPAWRGEFARDSKQNSIWQLPFVALGGRTDQTIVFYAANIYPEHIHLALNYGPFLKKLTGKFVMHKHYLKNMDEFLEINIELKQNILPSKVFAKSIENYIFNKLREINMEYLDVSTKNAHKLVCPVIKLWSYQHEKFFKPGLKPKYILTSK